VAAEQISTDPFIISGFDLKDNIQEWISKRTFSKIFILVDENTHRHCLPLLIGTVKSLRQAAILEVEPGEGSKSIEIASGLWETLLEQNADRRSLLINLGGGMITDLGGFVASTYMRGISFINLPTSLLAMVDAATGGKTGINIGGKKNSVGVFQLAEAVFADLRFLPSLPKREFTSGTAEVVKHALLQGEMAWKKLLETDFSDYTKLSDVVSAGIRFKKQVTDADFHETGKREQLNLGHTVAHAVESLYLEKGLSVTHGEAVAAGLIIENHISVSSAAGLEQSTAIEISTYVMQHFPPVTFTENDIATLISFMKSDKKNKGDLPYFSLLRAIGDCLPSQPVEERLIVEALRKYRSDVGN